MRIKKIIYLLLILAFILFASYIFQDKKRGSGNDSTVKYVLQEDWPRLPDGVKIGNPTGIDLDSSGNIVIFHRANRRWPLIGSMPDSYIKSKTILIVDAENGRLLNSWGDHFFIMPHGLTVDRQNNIWVTDVGLHQVFKFSYDGKLLMKLGESKKAGSDSSHFNRPTDIAVDSDGSVYVSDGYGNNRIVKFSATGKYLFEWGKKGDGPGEFNIPHCISVDPKGNVFVADRENNRIQVFSSDGRFIKQIMSESFANICAVATVGSKTFAVDDLSFLKVRHRGSDIFSIDSTGQVKTRFGRSEGGNKQVCWYHDIAVDSRENIFVGDILNNKVQQFRKISMQVK